MWAVILKTSSWSIRKTPVGAEGVAPAPATCGRKNRAATLDITTSALKPWLTGMLARRANPGIFELCHSMGNVIGVLPSTLKSYPLCVYFQMYSPSNTRNRPKACCKPAWNSLRKPGFNAPLDKPVQERSGDRTAFSHPVLDRIRFSLKGVSKVRAYERRSTVLLGLML